MNGLTLEERRRWFPDDFLAAIDSWFTADIACCDLCYDEFILKWPHAYAADGAEFQKSGYPLDVIYSGSRLAEAYTEAEFNEFIKDIECPRCGHDLDANIWAYNFPFDVDPVFEEAIDEIAEIAKATPFLILKHGFASQVYESLQQLGSSLCETTFDAPFFRARKGEAQQELSEFDAPPPRIVKEGRYNHAGGPVIYLATDEATCIEEMRRTTCTIAELKLTIPLKVLDLNDPDHSHSEFADQLSALTYSALMSAKQPDDGWLKPAYVFSRFVADCAKDCEIQAIKYPSTQILNNDNFNLVILDPTVRLKDHADLLNATSFAAEA